MYKKEVFYSLTTFIILVILNVLINIYVNPFGYYGDNYVGSPPIFNSRLEKFFQIQKLEKKPECIVLGSSNAMKMAPNKIKEFTGLNTFNYGVFQARSEDYYCIGELLTSKSETTPKLVILCIDDWNFAKEVSVNNSVFKGAERRLAYKPLLSQYLDDYSCFKLNWERVKSSVSWFQTKTSLKIIFNSLNTLNISRGKHKKYTDYFFEDGVRKYYQSIFEKDITKQAEDGKYDVEADLRKKHADLLTYSNHPLGLLSKSHELFNNYSDRRWDYFDRLIKNLSEHNVKVIINIMPIQPYYLELVKKHSNYNERRKILLKKLKLLKKKYPLILTIKDNHSIDQFNGLENHFFDHMHPTSYNSNLMIESIFKKLPKDAI